MNTIIFTLQNPQLYLGCDRINTTLHTRYTVNALTHSSCKVTGTGHMEPEARRIKLTELLRLRNMDAGGEVPQRSKNKVLGRGSRSWSTAPKSTVLLINFKYLFWLNIYFFSSEERTLWVKKQDTKLLPKTSPNINRFSNFFASRLSGKFATKLCLNIPPHLKYWNMLLHYLVKYECQKTGDNLKNALR